MEPTVAQRIAQERYRNQRNRFGEPVIDHAERVAAMVPAHARAIAWLHDVLEQTEVSPSELCEFGLSPVELAALGLLTRTASESYEHHALRIAQAPGPEGELARLVKLADLDDHLAHPRIPVTAPPYRWARRHIANADNGALTT